MAFLQLRCTLYVPVCKHPTPFEIKWLFCVDLVRALEGYIEKWMRISSDVDATDGMETKKFHWTIPLSWRSITRKRVNCDCTHSTHHHQQYVYFIKENKREKIRSPSQKIIFTLKTIEILANDAIIPTRPNASMLAFAVYFAV